MQKEIYAHSEHQFNKWKSFLSGNVNISDMYILAQTYANEIYLVCGRETNCRSDHDIFIMFAKAILPPKCTNQK